MVDLLCLGYDYDHDAPDRASLDGAAVEVALLITGVDRSLARHCTEPIGPSLRVRGDGGAAGEQP